MKTKSIFAILGLTILCFSISINAQTAADPINVEYTIGSTNLIIPDLSDLSSAYTDLSDPLENFLVGREKGGKWLHGIQGIVLTPVEWSNETIFYFPLSEKQDTAIIPGKFVEYTGSQTWRWLIMEAQKTVTGKNWFQDSETEPSFVYKIDFEPYRPEPSSVINSRNNASLSTKDCWWFPPLYLNQKSLKLISDNEKEEVICSLGSIECYKLTIQNRKLSQGTLDYSILLSNKVEAILWYDVIKGILVKEELKTDKEELVFTINKTNINLSNR